MIVPDADVVKSWVAPKVTCTSGVIVKFPITEPVGCPAFWFGYSYTITSKTLTVAEAALIIKETEDAELFPVSTVSTNPPGAIVDVALYVTL